MMTLFKGASIAVSIALTALVLRSGEPDSVRWWLSALPLWGWIIGPVWLPYGAAKAFDSAQPTVVLGAIFIGSTLLTAPAYFEASLHSLSAAGGLTFLFLPVFQWLGLILAIAVVAGVNSRAAEQA